MLNDTLAEWCADNADRFSWVASVPLSDELSAAEELARAADLGGVALMLPANVEGTNIGELRLDALWAAAARLAIPVILHRVLTTPSPRSAKFGLTQIVQYTFDTTLGVGSLMMSGVLDRHPKLTLILSHGGGALPYLAGRFNVMAGRMEVKAQSVTAQRPPADYVPRMAYDTIALPRRHCRPRSPRHPHRRIVSARGPCADRKPSRRRVLRRGYSVSRRRHRAQADSATEIRPASTRAASASSFSRSGI
jgi:Amidohydrolase